MPEPSAAHPDLICPRCAYDLSGPVPTWTESCPVAGICPECGLDCRWTDIFDPLRDVPSWFFEFAPLRRVPAFPSTLVRAHLPWGFWRDVKLSFPHRPRRLALFAALVLGVVWAFGIIALFLLSGFAYRSLYPIQWVRMSGRWVQRGGVFDIGEILPTLGRAAAWPLQVPVGPFGGPWAESTWFVVAFLVITPAGFFLLGETLGRAKVRAAHVLRAGVYTAAPAALLFCAVFALRIASEWYMATHSAWNNPNAMRLYRTADLLVDNEAPMLTPLIPWTVLCWWIVGRRYFRIEHPLSVALAMTSIATLAVLIPMLFFTSAFTDLLVRSF